MISSLIPSPLEISITSYLRLFLSNTFNLQIFPEDVYFLTEMPSEISLFSIVVISGFSILTSIFASLFPSLAVTKIETIKALKYE